MTPGAASGGGTAAAATVPAAALSLLLAVLLAGCTSSDGGEGPPSAAASAPADRPSGAASPTGQGSPATAEEGRPAVEVPQAPPRRACYRLGYAQVTEPTNQSASVPCGSRHTAQTFFVGRIDAVVDGHLVAVDSRLVEKQLATTCPQRLNAYVGGTVEDRALSRFEVAWFGPTLEQSDLGASWFRCDLVALSADGRLAPLPPPGQLRNVLDREGALDNWGLCGTAAPGTRGFGRVLCARRHNWQAIATIPLSGRGYPGAAAVRRAGDDICRDTVHSASGSPERFKYGWEWPTREQWSQGQRYGFCWAPD